MNLHTGWGSNELKRILASWGGLSPEDAGSLTFKDMEYIEQDAKYSQYITMFIQQLADEINKILKYNQGRNQQEVGQIYLIGEGSLLKSLPSQLSGMLQIPVSRIETCGQIHMPDNKPVTLYLNAAGAMLRNK